MNKYKGKRVPIIVKKENIILGFSKGYGFNSEPNSRASKCIIGNSIYWNGEATIDCTDLFHCAFSNADCVFNRDNYDIGLSYLIKIGIITKSEALTFNLDGGGLKYV